MSQIERRRRRKERRRVRSLAEAPLPPGETLVAIPELTYLGSTPPGGPPREVPGAWIRPWPGVTNTGRTVMAKATTGFAEPMHMLDEFHFLPQRRA